MNCEFEPKKSILKSSTLNLNKKFRVLEIFSLDKNCPVLGTLSLNGKFFVLGTSSLKEKLPLIGSLNEKNACIY